GAGGEAVIIHEGGDVVCLVGLDVRRLGTGSPAHRVNSPAAPRHRRPIIAGRVSGRGATNFIAMNGRRRRAGAPSIAAPPCPRGLCRTLPNTSRPRSAALHGPI